MSRTEPTPAVARAFEAARRHARLRGHERMGPLDLLFGLVDEEEGRPRLLLQRAGLDLAAIEQLCAASTGAGLLAEETVLEDARLVVNASFDPGALQSEQVLLALLRGEIGLRQQLEKLGLSFSQLEQEIAPVESSASPQAAIALDEPLRLAHVSERMDAGRILDAAGNRAREGLRVIEDYCRFVLDDAFLSRELKEMRHELAVVLGSLDPALGLAARETLRDVGTSLSTPAEQTRPALLSVVQANLKRLQEALRSLEEFAKLHQAAAGKSLEALRYRSYTLERMLVLGSGARAKLAEARLYLLVSAASCAASLEWTIQEAAAGGVDIVQLREKQLDDRSLLERARQVRGWTRRAGVLFIVNDRPDVACLVEADGVHLGQEDMPVKEARRIVGSDALIGVSTHHLEQLRQAIRDGASYVGVGPTFASHTKDFAALAGLEYVKQASAETSLPAFVLGGVALENVAQVAAAGAKRIAVSQALCQADEPRETARQLRAALLGN